MVTHSHRDAERRAKPIAAGIATILLLLLVAGWVLMLYPGAARELGHMTTLSRHHR